jgi:flavocytochrome c
MQSTSFKRRNFLKGVAVTLAAFGGSTPICAAERKPGDDWDREYDVVIVGSGFAGLGAAYGALKNGAKNIIILEKMEAYGGNSSLCGGLMSLPLNKKQKEKGIKDSVDLMVQDMVKAGRGFNNPELTRKFAEDAASVYDLLMECDVKLMDKVIRLGGHSAPRALVPTNASGGGIVVPLHRWLKKHGILFQNRAMVEEVIFTNGVVSGVKVKEGYDFDTKKFKRRAAYRSKGGVVIATGGWGQDPKFVKATMPVYAQLECTAQPGATAEMLQSLLKSGALPTMLDMYQLGPWASPDEKGAGPGSFFADYAFAEGISVDPKTGRRYMNELADRRTRADAQMEVLKKSTKDAINYPIVFCGEETTKDAEGFKAAYRDGCVVRDDTLEALAKRYSINLAELKKQVDEYNEIVAGKREDPFKKPLDVKRTLKGPFYSMRLLPKLHYCMGGIAITPKAEVLSVETLEPIPGLYAAGEITGGVHGMDRLGGCSSVDCLVFGKEAGKNVAKRL